MELIFQQLTKIDMCLICWLVLFILCVIY